MNHSSKYQQMFNFVPKKNLMIILSQYLKIMRIFFIRRRTMMAIDFYPIFSRLILKPSGMKSERNRDLKSTLFTSYLTNSFLKLSEMQLLYPCKLLCKSAVDVYFVCYRIWIIGYMVETINNLEEKKFFSGKWFFVYCGVAPRKWINMCNRANDTNRIIFAKKLKGDKRILRHFLARFRWV